MRFRTLFIPALFFVSGCTNPDGTSGEVGSLAWFDTASPEQVMEHYIQKCEGYGFRRGTEGMANCVAEENRSIRKMRSDFFS
jgi:hypothetical protein